MTHFTTALIALILISAFSNFEYEDSFHAGGKIILNCTVEGEEIIVISKIVVPGAVAARSLDGNFNYLLKDGAGNTLSAGTLDIPFYVYEDELNPDGSFSGGRRRVENFCVTLPYYNKISSIVLNNSRDGRSTEIDLNEIEDTAITPASLMDRKVSPPNFKEFLDLLDRVNDRSRKISSVSKRSSVAATKTVTIHAKVEGIDQSKLGVNARFVNLESGSSTPVNIYTLPVNVDLEEGEYEVSYLLRYADPVTAESYGSVYLLDSFNKKTYFNTNDNSLTLAATLGYLRSLQMKAPDGTGIDGTVRVFSPAKPQSTYEYSFENFATKGDGRLMIRMPSKAFPMVFQPADAHEEQVGAAVRIVKVSRFYSGITAVILPTVEAQSGDALQHIWGGEQEPFGPAAVDISNQLNILFMAEGYTDHQESFTDLNGNGVWDGDLLFDINGNGIQDEGEKHIDRNPAAGYNPPEPFEDSNGDRICNRFERAKFELDCAMNAAGMLNFYPFNELKDRINFFSYWTPSEHAVQRMSFTVPWVNSSTYFGVTSTEERSTNEGNNSIIPQTAASVLPDYTLPVVLINDPLAMVRSNAYSNFGRILQRSYSYGGIVFVHELGHSIGGLADEYVESGNENASYTGSDPGRVNVTTETDPARVKWRKYFNGTPPVPTPEHYQGYGLFEGAYYYGHGIYRPTQSSMMRDYAPFFAVNEEQLRFVLGQFRSSGRVNYQPNIIIDSFTYILKKRGDIYRLKTTATLKNSGKAVSDADHFYYYLSKDTKIDSDDTLLGSKPLMTLNPDQSINLKRTFKLKDPAKGKYNLIGLVDRENILSDVDMAFKVKVAPKKIRIK